jgi:membrane-bound serine protease (ClpP class)
MTGLTGTATTKLRPGGSARIGGRLLDVVSDGDFIEAGTPVVVISAAGNRILVRRAKS